MSEKITDENGNTYVQKKPFYKKWWFWLIAVILIIGIINPSEDSTEQTDNSTTENTTSSSSLNKSQTKKSDQLTKQQIKSYANRFGNKTVKELQRANSYAYPSTKDDENTVYGWRVDNVMFYRVDSPSLETTVYYLKDGDDETHYDNGYGIKAYEGRTIIR